MRLRKIIVGLSCGLALLGIRIAAAHHSIAGQFDMQHGVTISGVVSKVDWINPHIQIYVDVKDKQGKAETWQLEGVPVAMARKAGLTKAMVEGDGSPVTVDLYPARDGTKHLGFLLKITFQDGRVFQFSADTRETGAAK